MTITTVVQDVRGELLFRSYTQPLSPVISLICFAFYDIRMALKVNFYTSFYMSFSSTTRRHESEKFQA